MARMDVSTKRWIILILIHYCPIYGTRPFVKGKK